MAINACYKWSLVMVNDCDSEWLYNHDINDGNNNNNDSSWSVVTIQFRVF